MTRPIEMLEQRLDEIKQIKDQDIDEKEREEIVRLYNEFYACIKILKNKYIFS